MILGNSDDEFQIPNLRGLQPGLGLDVNGQTDFPSDDLSETQHELTQYAKFSLDSLFGTGLRQSLALPGGASIPNADHTPSYQIVNLGVGHAFRIAGAQPLTARLDAINLFDKVYEIRSGTGIGVFAPQWGERRGVFGGLEWDF
jgi:outer membrane receptor protein involved in Fe transport